MPVSADARAQSWWDHIFEFHRDGMISTEELRTAMEYVMDVRNLSAPTPKTDSKNIITYSVGMWPALTYPDIPAGAMEAAITTWEYNNPGLLFVQSDYNPDIRIEWDLFLSEEYAGLATCTDFSGIGSIDCTLDIALGDYDCTGEFVQGDVDFITHTIMHEVGHALGIGHTSDETHLMFGPDPTEPFDTKGYRIPDSLDGTYVGQDEIDGAIDDTGRSIDKLYDDIREINVPIDELKVELDLINDRLIAGKDRIRELEMRYEFYESGNLSENQYNQAMRIYDLLNMEYEDHKVLVNQYNEIVREQTVHIDESNMLSDEYQAMADRQSVLVETYNCYPNVGD